MSSQKRWGHLNYSFLGNLVFLSLSRTRNWGSLGHDHAEMHLASMMYSVCRLSCQTELIGDKAGCRRDKHVSVYFWAPVCCPDDTVFTDGHVSHGGSETVLLFPITRLSCTFFVRRHRYLNIESRSSARQLSRRINIPSRAYLKSSVLQWSQTARPFLCILSSIHPPKCSSIYETP